MVQPALSSDPSSAAIFFYFKCSGFLQQHYLEVILLKTFTFRPHRIYEIRTSAIVCQAVCLSRGRGCAKTAERIDALFTVETPGNPRKNVFDEIPIPTPTARGRGFDAAFAKLLWPLVGVHSICMSASGCYVVAGGDCALRR